MTKKNVQTEIVPFRLLQMPCCGHLFCNVNARFPSFCPACGKSVINDIKGCVVIHDPRAILKVDYGSESTKKTQT